MARPVDIMVDLSSDIDRAKLHNLKFASSIVIKGTAPVPMEVRIPASFRVANRLEFCCGNISRIIFTSQCRINTLVINNCHNLISIDNLDLVKAKKIVVTNNRMLKCFRKTKSRDTKKSHPDFYKTIFDIHGNSAVKMPCRLRGTIK